MTDPILPPAPAYAAAPAVVPGKTLGIVGLVLAFLVPLVGLILSLVARSQSKAAGVQNTPATVGIIVAIVFMILGIIISATSLAGLMATSTLGN